MNSESSLTTASLYKLKISAANVLPLSMLFKNSNVAVVFLPKTKPKTKSSQLAFEFDFFFFFAKSTKITSLRIFSSHFEKCLRRKPQQYLPQLNTNEPVFVFDCVFYPKIKESSLHQDLASLNYGNFYLKTEELHLYKAAASR